MARLYSNIKNTKKTSIREQSYYMSEEKFKTQTNIILPIFENIRIALPPEKKIHYKYDNQEKIEKLILINDNFDKSKTIFENFQNAAEIDKIYPKASNSKLIDLHLDHFKDPSDDDP